MSGFEYVLPDDSVEEFALLVVSYFDADGIRRFYVGANEDVHASAALGLLELAKFKVMEAAS